MSSRARLALVLLVLLAPVSLVGKLLTRQDGDGAASVAAGMPPAVTSMLRAGGYVEFGHMRLINGPAYGAVVYGDGREPALCKGLVYLLPMAVNAEAGALLSRPSGRVSTDHFFVFRGRVTDRFPSFVHWLARLTGQIGYLLGGAPPDVTVVGVATTASCMNPRQLPWGSLSD